MLKWAVNTPRLSYLKDADANVNSVDSQHKTLVHMSADKLKESNETPFAQSRTPTSKRQRLKRKSSDFYLSRRLQNWLEKENQLEEKITSTPLQPHAKLYASNGSLRRINSLKDLSSIIPNASICTSVNTTPKPAFSNIAIPNPCLTSFRATRNNPTNYAATLPTLEVEYSPCGIVPGPILALRGLGIADTYFEKPRYLPPEDTPPLQPVISNTKAINPNTQGTYFSVNNAREDTASLSSSKMGDQTLERMIDAILESTRKEKRHIKFARQFHHHHRTVMSPTYTKAEDPANDLSEFWCETQKEDARTQPIRKKRFSLPAQIASTELFSEREVRSPIGVSNRMRRLQDTNLLHLRRQRAIRRKRKLSKSNGKCFNRSKSEIPEVMKEQNDTKVVSVLNAKSLEDASPDSGHNSCSELEDNSITIESESLPIVNSQKDCDACTLDATKRRLSFSNKTIPACP